MPSDLRPGPDSAPADELASAEASLAVLQHVLHRVAGPDKSKQTPCSKYNVKELTTHLVNSIATLGGLVGGKHDVPDDTDSVERLVIGVARPALDAWHKHGLDGDISVGPGWMTAREVVSLFSIEFLVHGWDYAVAVGCDINAAEPLSEYVLELAQQLIKPHQRASAGFDAPIDMPDDASALRRLVAFTGRYPSG